MLPQFHFAPCGIACPNCSMDSYGLCKRMLLCSHSEAEYAELDITCYPSVSFPFGKYFAISNTIPDFAFPSSGDTIAECFEDIPC